MFFSYGEGGKLQVSSKVLTPPPSLPGLPSSHPMLSVSPVILQPLWNRLVTLEQVQPQPSTAKKTKCFKEQRRAAQKCLLVHQWKPRLKLPLLQERQGRNRKEKIEMNKARKSVAVKRFGEKTSQRVRVKLKDSDSECWWHFRQFSWVT